MFTSTFPRWLDDTLPPFIFLLAKHLTDRFDVSVLTPMFTGARKFEEIDGMKINRYRYFLRKHEKLAGSTGMLSALKNNRLMYFVVPFFLVFSYIALRKAIREIRPDMIHAHWILPQGLIARLAAKPGGVPFVVTTWGGDMFIFKKPGWVSTALKKSYRGILNAAAASTSVNTVFVREMRSVAKDGQKVYYIPNGVDTRQFSPEKADPRIRGKYGFEGPFLLFVGRLTHKKGVDILLSAMPRIVAAFPKTCLLIVGTGVLESSLKGRTRELRLEGSIIFAGALPNEKLPSFYATADVFIAPSVTTGDGDREGLPTVLLEAMASGVPVVASRIDGAEGVIDDGCNGMIVEQGNPEQLAETVISILARDGKNAMGRCARASAVERFDWRVVAGKYAELLMESMNP